MLNPYDISKHRRMVWLCCLAVGCAGILFTLGKLEAQSQVPEHQPLQYDVQVDAQIIPIYAVDSEGNPVFDLKAEEIELRINRAPQNILYFMSYQVESKAGASGNKEEATNEAKEIKEAEETGTGGQAEIKEIKEPAEGEAQGPVTMTSDSPERLNFIILDGISNSKSGVRNGKTLAEGLIKAGGPGDGFIILISNIRSGLKYIAGPDKNKTRLLQVLDKIYQDPRWIVLMPSKAFMSAENPAEGELMMWSILNPIAVFEQGDVKNQYQSALSRFSSSLEDLKKALKTIRLPKKIFLVSGGIQEIASFSESIVDMQGLQGKYEQAAIIAYYGMLQNAAVAINEGGSLLYMINPIPETNKIRSAVKIMSEVSNAKCISANNAEDLLKQVQKNTAAYYEVAFSVTPEMKENFKIDLTCTRKGVRLNTLEYGEKARPYTAMDESMKKLFALNVVTGGSWSRMVGKLAPARFQKLEEIGQTEKNGDTIKKISLLVPMEFKDKKVDIFVVNIKPNTMKADIEMSRRLMMNPNEIVEVAAQEQKDQYIVLVEPEKTLCLFSRVL